ncbi:MAG: YfhO family protein [Terriglobia bacterium]
MPRLPLAARLWLIFQPILFYWDVLVRPTAHIPYDLESYHYPTLAWIAACIRHHQWPFWDPSTYAGMPIHADIQAQMFYPPAWLAIAIGNLTGGRALFYWVEWLVAAHMILAGLFTFLLLRRLNLSTPAALLGSTAYQLGGFFASQACHLGAICAGAWLPLAILAAYELRRGFRAPWFAALATAVALSILSGYAATAIVVAGALILFALALIAWREASWRILPLILAAFVLAALICAVQLIPLIRLTSWSIASLRSQWLTAWGAPLESLVSLVSPDHYHLFDLARYRLPYNFTLLYIYCGIAPLILLLLSPFRRRAWMFAALTVVSAVWMLGEHTPVYGLVFGALPALVRGASYAWYAMMAFCLFAGITAAIVADDKRLSPAVLWTLALLTSFDLLHAGRNRPMNTAPGSYAVANSEDRYAGSPENLRQLQALVNVSTPPLRIDYADLWAPGVIMGGMLRLPTTDGNIPFMPRRMFLLRQLFCATEPSPADVAIAGRESPIFRRNLPVNRLHSPLLRMQNVGFVASTASLPGATESIAGLSLYRVPNPLPRFYLVPTVRPSSGPDQTFEWLANPSFLPEAEAIVEGFTGGSGASKNLGAGSVHTRLYEPDRVELDVQTNAEGFLATSEAWYPGWQATVNGHPQPLLLTNGVFRGLSVPSGSSLVVMTYQPVDLKASAALSLIAIAFTIGCAFSSRHVKRRAQPAARESEAS